jgi:hypothetical protein
MRTFLVSSFALLAILLGATAAAQDEATPGAMTSRHPFVGTWLLDTNADDPANAPEVLVVTADGAYISVDAEGYPSVGVWETTGATTALVTLTSPGLEEDGSFAGTFVIRATVEVDASGDNFTATYSGEFVMPDGTGTGEYGPGTATATRLRPEAMGTPVGPVDVLFEEGTPQATPAP